MANLDDLGPPSITDMQTDEAIELLRQIRLQRRTPNKPPKSVTKQKQTKEKMKADISPEMAAELLKILTGGQ